VDDRPQTNLQLLNQLRHTGYPADDVERVKAAYDFVSGQFAGWFRGSGKPFLAHLVGTAGILGAVRARTPVVLAGLSHAVYQLGELPAGAPGMSHARRAQVQRVLGTEAEDLVARYAALEWNVRSLPALRARLPALSPADRDVVLMRLANELDDHLDLAVLYCANAEDRRRRIGAGLRLVVEIAKELGFPELASSLDRAFDATLTARIPSALRTQHPVSFSVATPSLSWRRSARLRQIFAGLRRRSARLLGRSA
jgi:(p)ppGpp synthase/HD superfamily hydrolase